VQVGQGGVVRLVGGGGRLVGHEAGEDITREGCGVPTRECACRHGLFVGPSPSWRGSMSCGVSGNRTHERWQHRRATR
jgi:hypothetical protein